MSPPGRRTPARSQDAVTTPLWYPQLPDDEAAEQVSRAFEAAYGRRPDGVWAAPGRVNLIGEHVDYNAGRCLPLALPHRTYVALAVRDDRTIRAHSPGLRRGSTAGPRRGSTAGPRRGSETRGALDDDTWWEGSLEDVAPGRVQGWAGYVAGIPWALARVADGRGALAVPAGVPGFDAEISSAVPVGSGLSSSAALECAVALALDDLLGLGLAGGDIGRSRLAAVCVNAENEIAGAPTGGMDQTAALRCRAGHALALDCRDFSIRQVPFDLAAAGLELVVIDTRARHALADGQYGSRRQACTEACQLLGLAALGDLPVAELDAALAKLPGRELRRRVRHVVTEIARVDAVASLLDAGRMGEIGPLLDASHVSLRDDYEVSCAELDVACDAACAAGALGARMTGGGFGGSAIALAERKAVPDVAAAVATAFAREGFAAPAFLRVTPSGPGARVG
jgi:galactokinase